ncbi:MAG: 30S ribosome-binding factor RbfA [Bacteroidales bacterium]|nr:30S ribosome-binding factor RbfA [Bacteroidales bacterium]
MESQRQEKVSRLIQKELAQLFQVEVKDLFPGAMITVTKVTVTRDLAEAKVYLSLFAVKDKPALLKQIKKRRKELRFLLGREVAKQMRVIPELSFYEDDSLDYLDNINRLLKE